MATLMYTCHCGQSITPKRWRAGKRSCVDCAMAKLLLHNLQMSAKQGDAWNRWRAGILRTIEPNPDSTKEKSDDCQG